MEATASPTLETPIPTNVANCVNSASFVADVTIPDYSDLPASSTFTKTWRIKNTGTCIWGPDYTVSHYSEEAMGAPTSWSLSVTYPGETADISLNLIAPSSNGRHRGNFVIKNPEGKIMSVDSDSRLWLIINVTGATASASSSTPFCKRRRDNSRARRLRSHPRPSQGCGCDQSRKFLPREKWTASLHRQPITDKCRRRPCQRYGVQ
ncbi:MAG: NBR1-Ig-like domain-containing protein [Anaerolineales bacterium]